LALPAQCTIVATPQNGSLDPLAGGQVSRHELDALARFVTVPAEHPHRATRVPQQGQDVAPERAGAAGEQDW